MLCAAAVLAGATAHAQVVSTWFGQSGNWNNGDFWRNSNGIFTFPNNGNFGLTYDAVINSGTPILTQNITIDDLFLSGSSAVSTGQFSLTLAKGGTWSAGQLVGTGTTVIGPGATFNIGGGTQFLTDQTLLNQGTINFSDSFAAGQSLVLIRTATINNAGIFNITADGHITADGTGVFNNSGTLVKSSAGVALIDSNIAFNNSGTVSVTGGTLEIFGGGTETGTFNIGGRTNYVVAGGTNQFQATSKITGTGSVFFQGGSTTINGTYNVSNTIVRGVSPTVSFDSPASTTAMAVQGGSVFVDNNLRAGTLSVTGGSFTVDFGGQFNGGIVTLNGGTTLVAPPQITITARPHAAATPALAGGPLLSATTLNVISGANICGPGGTILVGSGGLIFTGNSSPTLTLDSDIISPGVLQLQGDVTFTGTDGTASIANNGPVPIPGTIDLQGGQRTFTVNDGAQPIDMQVSAQMMNGSIRKDGAGTLQLSGSSTYSGGTTLSGGVLEVDSASALGSAAVTFAGGTLRLAIPSPAVVSNALTAAPANSINMDIGAGSYQMGALTLGAAFNLIGTGSISFTGPISMAPAGSAVGPTTINAIANLTFAGPVSGGLGLIKTFGGTLTFSGAGANTYGGTTQILDGTLVLSKPAGTVAVPGDLAIVGTSTVLLTASDQIAAGSHVSFNSAGGTPSLLLGGQNQTVAMIGSVQNGAGSIQLGSGTLTVSGNGVVGNFSGSIQGIGRLSKTGNGMLTLGGANTFGGITVGGGVLQLGADQHVSSFISTGGQLDVQRSQLVVSYPLFGFTPAPAIRAALHAGGITSSLNNLTRTVGFADASDGTVSGLTFHTVVVKLARLGDINLDGVVNFTDLLDLAQHYGQTNMNWDQGDLNYDGVVNFADLLGLAQNYGGTFSAADLPPLSPATAADIGQAFAQVPEPGHLALLATGAAGLLARRRSNSIHCSNR